MKDRFNREIEYMRLSITSECNLSCIYCNPEGACNKTTHKGKNKYFSPQELEEICTAATKCGISSFRITGGEPLLRPDCEEIISRISGIEGVRRVSLTTNGRLLTPKRLSELISAGLRGINISLDTVDPETDRRISGSGGLGETLEGIRSAANDGRLAVKTNTVLLEGINDTPQEILALAELARELPAAVRFIELMPIGPGGSYKGRGSSEVLRVLKDSYPKITRDLTAQGNGPAKYYRIEGFKGRIGFIDAIEEKFCSRCNRLRLTSDGDLKPCLCYAATENLRDIFKENDIMIRMEKLKGAIERAIEAKPEGHCFEHREKISEENSMVNIGG